MPGLLFLTCSFFLTDTKFKDSHVAGTISRLLFTGLSTLLLVDLDTNWSGFYCFLLLGSRIHCHLFKRLSLPSNKKLHSTAT
ncbi:hypothetical protein HDK90DRAFT_174083 [Phyllosticta capitalensis]|uniref:Uncharacterized protein n=1 Tax=Phyllosticta capitalensis TaxID=121624 RepID=A0ABR1YVG5_9PEZI